MGMNMQLGNMRRKYFLWIPIVLLGGLLYLLSTGGSGSEAGQPSPAEGAKEDSAAIDDSRVRSLPVEAPADPDSATLASLTDRAGEIPSLRSLLVYQKNTPVMEEYYRGITSSSTMNLKSASKSVLSLLIGIAVEQGIIGSVEDSVHTYLPEYFEDISDPRKRTITIKDLLTMRAGLESTSIHNYGRWVVSDNWVEYALEQPMVEEPGGEMVYSTGSSHLLSVILTKTSGMSTRAFALEHLFGPLNIQPGGWDRDPQGYYMGGNNMALRPADMRKLGRLVLNGGSWEGEQLVPRTWLRDSFQTYTRSNYNPYNYGYMWWKKPVAGYNVRFAWGHGGQYIFMIRELDAVVVITSSLANTSQRRSYRDPVFDMLEESIIPMLEGEA